MSEQIRHMKIPVGGAWITTDNPLKVMSPYGKDTIAGTTYLGGIEELTTALDKATEIFPTLKKMPAYKRADILENCVTILKRRVDEIALAISLEAGKPMKDALVESQRAQNVFKIAAEEAKRLGGEVLPLDLLPGSENRSAILKRFPVGPVFGISSFNFPLNLVCHKVAPAIACGCPIIIKPASQTPFSSLILAEVCEEAGLPLEAFSVVPSPGREAEKLLDDDRVKKLTFTGSPQVGWHLKQKANKMPVTLELGGNAGVIIDEGSDIEYAASRSVVGAFSYAGQVCISLQRILVHENIFDEFKDAFVKKVKALKLGDPSQDGIDLGPMIDTGSAEAIDKWVKEAVSEGATLLAGGTRDGNLFTPTVLTDTKSQMNICAEEAFAPVCVLEKFSDFDQALEEINNSKFGLQAGVFTNDINRAFKSFEELNVGGVIINDIPTYRVDHMPYGGVKESGFGREGIKYTIESMTSLKLLALKLEA